MSSRFLIALLAITAVAIHHADSYVIESSPSSSPRRLQAGPVVGFVDADGGADGAAAARAQEIEYIKRFLPAKERRAPLDGFEDMSGFLRTIDGIQKPRFG